MKYKHIPSWIMFRLVVFVLRPEAKLIEPWKRGMTLEDYVYFLYCTPAINKLDPAFVRRIRALDVITDINFVLMLFIAVIFIIIAG